MKKSLFLRPACVFLGILALAFLPLQTGTPASAHVRPDLAGKWDRLNPDQGNPTPEHEVLRCGGNASPTCVYDKQPEPRLGFENPPDSTSGRFRGKDITEGWLCPEWLPQGVCANTTFVANGTMKFRLSDGSPLAVSQELIVTELDGDSVLYVYWVDQGVACPWFRSFEEAIAANPFPLPFNGVDWPGMDCLLEP